LKEAKAGYLLQKTNHQVLRDMHKKENKEYKELKLKRYYKKEKLK